jgi:hypothetical protein
MSSPNKEINKFNSKQPATGKMAWTMRVLTTEYLIDGSFDWDKQYFKFDLARDVSSERGVRAFWFKTWTGVQVQPTGNLTTPLQSLPEWTLASGLNVVTIIPNDEALPASRPKGLQQCPASAESRHLCWSLPDSLHFSFE